MINGQDRILQNLRRAIANIEEDVNSGLLRAALAVLADSNEFVPKEFGVLLNSGYSLVDEIRHVATVGYTANYASYVHEMPASYNYTSPGTGPKYLQRSVDQNRDAIVRAVQGAIRLRVS